MKTLFAAAAILSIFGAGAFAADMPAAPSEEAVVSEISDWTGAYVGLSGGGAWGDAFVFDDTPAESAEFDLDGFVVGGTVGFNFQLGSMFVAGVEGDLSYAEIDGDGPTSFGFGCGSDPGCFVNVDWLATVRGRLGVAFDQILVFGTGGFAIAGEESGIADFPEFDNDDEATGWTAGGGIEFKFAENWSAKVEYLHVDLEEQDPNDEEGAGGDAEFDLVRGGLNFHF